MILDKLTESRTKQIERILDKNALDVIQEQPVKFARALFYLLEKSGWKLPYHQVQGAIDTFRKDDIHNTKNKWFDSANTNKIEFKDCEYKSYKEIPLDIYFYITGTKIKIKSDVYYNTVKSSEGDLRQSVSDVLNPIVSSINKIGDLLVKSKEEKSNRWDVLYKHEKNEKKKNIFTPLIEFAKKKNILLIFNKNEKYISFEAHPREDMDENITDRKIFTHQVKEIQKLFDKIIPRANSLGYLLVSYGTMSDGAWLRFILAEPNTATGGYGDQKEVKSYASWKENQENVLSNMDNFFARFYASVEDNYHIVIRKLFRDKS